MKIVAIVHEAKEGGYWAEIPALPGAVTEADTLEELECNIREVAALYLEDDDTPATPDPKTDKGAFCLTVPL
ncbi:MAG TPA: type II toxin-antitoxin system HicB family antitoxin [Thermomicrobiales bacterium]|nr:type II toxin-antitoxin system HicB family antitoxin [Thermomicrobiales bacterium]